jgi:hypothetical protein
MFPHMETYLVLHLGRIIYRLTGTLLSLNRHAAIGSRRVSSGARRSTATSWPAPHREDRSGNGRRAGGSGPFVS